MEIELERYDENDIPYTLIVEVEYNCSPLEYEAGCYFAGGVEIENAKIIDIINEPDGEEGTTANISYKIGDNVTLTDSEVESAADEVYRMIERTEGRYPRHHYSPDW